MTRTWVRIALSLVVISALAVPATAFARGGAGHRAAKPTAKAGKGAQAKGAATAAAKKPVKVAKAGGSSAAAKKKAAAASTAPKGKEKAKAAKVKKTKPAAAPVAAEEPGEAPESSEASKSPWASRDTTPTAFLSITKNIEKMMAKVAAGTKKQLPPGLQRVWLKFAGWLGVTTPAPWLPVVPDPVVEQPDSVTPTPRTVDPSPTVEPTPTVPPAPTAEPVPLS